LVLNLLAFLERNPSLLALQRYIFCLSLAWLWFYLVVALISMIATCARYIVINHSCSHMVLTPFVALIARTIVLAHSLRSLLDVYRPCTRHSAPRTCTSYFAVHRPCTRVFVALISLVLCTRICPSLSLSVSSMHCTRTSTRCVHVKDDVTCAHMCP
jgi:hypothetical protein